jgi:hypothetical protein
MTINNADVLDDDATDDIDGADDGAAGDDAVDADASDDGTDDADETDDAGAEQLRDAGKQALDRMKQRLKLATQRATAAEAKLAAAVKPKPTAPAKRLPAAAKPNSATSAEVADLPDAEEIRAQVTAEVNASVLKGRVLDRVEARAARLFADPEDAVALLRSKVDDLIDGDQVDNDAITLALEELLKKKPHLAAQSGKRFTGGADGGARNGKTEPNQLTEKDLARMTPQQIVKARADGRLANLLGGTS